jgi:hypothetical protein
MDACRIIPTRPGRAASLSANDERTNRRARECVTSIVQTSPPPPSPMAPTYQPPPPPSVPPYALPSLRPALHPAVDPHCLSGRWGG